MAEETREKTNFIWEAIKADIAEGKNGGRVQTRFPPEPNGYLHIGHVKALSVDFLTAERFGGVCNLRFDDTNPTKEKEEFVEAIKDDIHWLGFNYANVYYASEQYDQIYEFALDLIRRGLAYVDDLSKEEIREYRGTLTQPGKNSPYRDRTPEENMDLFLRMKNGEFPDGSHTLRAKIDMASPNMNLRDPAIYRIVRAHHHRQGDKWCIYPLYDYAHPIQDALEGITHSLCSIEFENHRPLYDWVVDNIGFEHKPHQYEFARLNVTHTVMSKRYLRELVEMGIVDGWDDPRLVSIAALRRRGFTPESIKKFVELCGISKAQSSADYAMLEYCIREDLKAKAPRMMAILDPVKLVIDNYPEGQTEMLPVVNNPENEALGSREVPFGKELYIEREDFMEEPPKKYFRMFPGNEVRLMSAYFVKCTGCVKDENGKVVEVHCTYDPESRGGNSPDGRKVKGTIHWVNAEQSVKAQVRLYENIIDEEKGVYNEDGSLNLNPNSLTTLTECRLEPAFAQAQAYDRFQFVRQGFFCVDYKDTKLGELVFNRIVSLKSSYVLPK